MYKKLKIYYVEDRENLNRELIVKANIGLVDLRIILMATLWTDFCHLSEFVDGKNIYAEPAGYNEDSANQKHMADYSLADLSDKFMFAYDFGEGWDFQIEVEDVQKPEDMKGIVRITSGFGAGLWEDNKHGQWQASMMTPAQRKNVTPPLHNLQTGEITECEMPKIEGVDLDDFSFPHNLMYHCIDDVFQPIDIELNQLRIDFMLDVYADVFIEEIINGDYFKLNYKENEFWKFANHELDFEDRHSALERYMAETDCWEYSSYCKLIIEANDFYLSEFYDWLLDSGLSQKTTNKHCSNVNFYISTFLLREDTQPCKYGTAFVNLFEFHCYFLPEKCMWGTPSGVSNSCASIKKFYKFMSEKGYVSEASYKNCVNIIKQCKQEWMEAAKEDWL